MRLFVALTVFVALACSISVNTLPAVYDGPTYELTAIEDPVYDEVPANLAPIRNRRWACNLSSWDSKWNSIHGACAHKCLMQRYRDGRCQNGVCVCRN